MHWATRGDNKQEVDEGRKKRHFKWSTVKRVINRLVSEGYDDILPTLSELAQKDLEITINLPLQRS